ncbi:unnamed protein product [Callosobruchus maculatus]|uniref:Uncharacterized protein n=1 Tax=Callosobruchus maculatus TaxID=64391 RepID=A0A653BUM8_CALMS|nr:unnamed protein product [Callosobruchus maculatus]
MAYLQLGEACGHDILYFFYCFFSVIGILVAIFIYPEGTNRSSLDIFTELKNQPHIYRLDRNELIFRSQRR